MTHQPQTPPGLKPNLQEPGFLEKQVRQAKLFWRCFRDRRVSFFLKLTYLGSTFVAVLTYGLVPDLIPGPLDDLLISPIAIPLVLSYVFTELCPGWIVSEHRQAIDEEDKAELKDGPKDVQTSSMI